MYIMYNQKMKRELLKKILLQHYSRFTVESILSGRRKPSIEKRIDLNTEFNIPILAWQDIKSYINENITSNENKNELQKEGNK